MLTNTFLHSHPLEYVVGDGWHYCVVVMFQSFVAPSLGLFVTVSPSDSMVSLLCGFLDGVVQS